MDILERLLYGFSVGLQPQNLFFCFLGALLGTLVGVLPGIGPMGAMAILLPITFKMDPVSAIIMLSGIYYGAMYGGSTTSILVNIPGEAASIVTCFDGYQMAKQGRAGAALGISAFGSFIAGTFGVIGLMFFAGPLAEFGLKFGPPEYFGVIFVSLTLIGYLSQGSTVKALMMGAFGLILSCIGLDPMEAQPRMTFDIIPLWDGVGILPIVVGLFGVAEILINLEESGDVQILKTKIKNIFPTISDWIKSTKPILRGTVLGFFLGILPGGNPASSSFISYAVEKRLSKEPEKFGHGAIEGVAGPESANNSCTSGNFIPFLTLGIPPNVIMALFYGALLIHGLRPGPLFISEHPDIFWGLVSSMYIGNVMLLVLNLPLIPMWVQVLKVPYRILFPLILLFCIIGVYCEKYSSFDLILMIIFGILGYLFRKFDYEPGPLCFGFVLGRMLETNLRHSMALSCGSFSIFFTRPIAAVCVILGLILVLASILSFFLKRKKCLL